MRQQMHRRAAIYYEEEEPDLFKSAWHYQRAGEEQQAAVLAANNVWSILNRGYAHGLRQLLAGFDAQHLSTMRWAEVNLARGEVYAYLGDSAQAQRAYEAVLTLFDKMTPSAAVAILKVQAYMGLGDLQRYIQPDQSLAWLQRGLQELPEGHTLMAADLHIKNGLTHYTIGNLDLAAHALRKLTLLSDRGLIAYYGAHQLGQYCRRSGRDRAFKSILPRRPGPQRTVA
ncbi:MAG: hypothetical protein R2911_32135 [Caldilineaceae bacterium]